MALAKAFEISGLSIWLGEQMISLKGLNLFIILIVLIAAVNFLTEITSNLATTAMLLPVLASLSVLLEVHPFIIMTGATVAASCAFMLPAATPPNAVVFYFVLFFFSILFFNFYYLRFLVLIFG